MNNNIIIKPQEIINLFNGSIGYLNNSERKFYIIQMCTNDKYRADFINKTEAVRKLSKKHLNILLPLIWEDKDINHERVAVLLQLYKSEKSDQIIRSLNIKQEIKDFYLDKYNQYMIIYNARKTFEKLSGKKVYVDMHLNERIYRYEKM